MMKYELENFMKGFIGEIEIIIELNDGKEISTGISEAKYYMASDGTGYIQLIPSSVLIRQPERTQGLPGNTKLTDEEIIACMKKHNNNKTHVARELCVDRRTIRRRCEKL